MSNSDSFVGLSQADQIRLETRKDAFVRTLDCAIFEGQNNNVGAMVVLLADAAGMAQSVKEIIEGILKDVAKK